MILKKKDFKEKQVEITLRDLELIIQSLLFFRSISFDFSLIHFEIMDKSSEYYIINRDITDLCERLQGF